jgi:uncharacterized protein (DUF952 family)
VRGTRNVNNIVSDPMKPIYHIIPRASWEQRPAGPYRAESLATEGFIHCSYAEQVAWVANSFFRDQAHLLLLVIDSAKLSCPVRDEDPGIEQKFPHVYGAINPEAVVEVLDLKRGPDGAWVFPE